MKHPKVKTLEQAYRFVKRAKICLIFADERAGIIPLWEVVDLPDRRKGEGGWGQRVSAIWRWKNELPADYPDEIFYGKIAGGKAALMTLDYLKTELYPQAHVPVAKCSLLAQTAFEFIRIEPRTTAELRAEVLKGERTRRAAFAKALIELQVTLNITRSNDPEIETDTWLSFKEQYPQF